MFTKLLFLALMGCTFPTLPAAADNENNFGKAETFYLQENLTKQEWEDRCTSLENEYANQQTDEIHNELLNLHCDPEKYCEEGQLTGCETTRTRRQMRRPTWNDSTMELIDRYANDPTEEDLNALIRMYSWR